MITPDKVCAVILAGGRGARMGGVDKGLQLFRGLPLARHALNRLQKQAGGAPALIGINANRNQATYSGWGCPVWADAEQDYPGPLAGFLAALEHAQDFEYLLTVPCDSPLFPLDLLPRLAHGLSDGQAGLAGLAVAHAPEAQEDGTLRLRSQPVFCLLPTRLTPNLREYLQQGGRKIDAWTATHQPVAVAFDQAGDAANAFANANTFTELTDLEQP